MTDPATAVAMLAHQGGWDEILLVGVPIAVIIALLAVVKRRVDSIAVPPPTDDESTAG